MCRKAYIVKEYGGQWEDSWERIYAVCLSKKTADAKLEESRRNYTPLIDINTWDSLKQSVEDYEEETLEKDVDFKGFDSYTEGIVALKLSNLPIEELFKAEDVYEENSLDGYSYSEIVEADLFD